MKRLSNVVFLNLVLFASLLACGGLDTAHALSPTADKTLTFGTFSKSLGNSPYHIAKHFGWFETNPELMKYKINYVEYNDRPTISQALDKGELQMLLSAEVPAIMCFAQGNRIQVIDIASTVHLNFLVRPQLNANSMQDLKGKSIGLLRGTSSHYGLLKYLKEHDLSLRDFDVRYMAPIEARTAFESGQLDAWIVWSPFIDIQLMKNTGKELSGTSYPITNTVSVPRKLIEEKPRLVKAFVTVIEKAKRWIVEHPKEASPIIAQELGLDHKVVDAALKKFSFGKKVTKEVITDLQAKANFLAEEDKTRLDRPVNIRNELLNLNFIK